MKFPKVYECTFGGERAAHVNAELLRKIMEQLIRPDFIDGVVRLHGGWRVRIEDAFANDFGEAQEPHGIFDFGSTELPLSLPDIPKGMECVSDENTAVLKVEYHETVFEVDYGYDDDDTPEGSAVQNAGVLTVIVAVDERAVLDFPPTVMTMLIAGFYNELLQKHYPSSYVVMNREKLRTFNRYGELAMV